MAILFGSIIGLERRELQDGMIGHNASIIGYRYVQSPDQVPMGGFLGRRQVGEARSGESSEQPRFGKARSRESGTDHPRCLTKHVLRQTKRVKNRSIPSPNRLDLHQLIGI